MKILRDATGKLLLHKNEFLAREKDGIVIMWVEGINPKLQIVYDVGWYYCLEGFRVGGEMVDEEIMGQSMVEDSGMRYRWIFDRVKLWNMEGGSTRLDNGTMTEEKILLRV